MNVPTYTLADPLQIHTFFRGFRSRPPCGWWFRGQEDKSWPLVPRAGRTDYFLPQTDATANVQRDLGRFNDWRQRAVAYLDTLPTNDWECLAVAQHHGLATRLLDWTFNPLVGVFFACWERPESDGCVYCYEPPAFINTDAMPLHAEIVGIGYIPRAISPRILNQRGAFTVHGPPTKQIEPEDHPFLPDTKTLVRLDVPAALKGELLEHLDIYGVNRATLFPDIDGLCAHVNYETRGILRLHHNRRGTAPGDLLVPPDPAV